MVSLEHSCSEVRTAFQSEASQSSLQLAWHRWASWGGRVRKTRNPLTRPGALISATRILLTTLRSRKSIVRMWISLKSPGPTIQETNALMNSIRSWSANSCTSSHSIRTLLHSTPPPENRFGFIIQTAWGNASKSTAGSTIGRAKTVQKSASLSHSTIIWKRSMPRLGN